jgi:hypothetical protein
MATALNLTLKIKQDPETIAELTKIKENFAVKIQPEIDKALREYDGVHYARVLVIDDLYIQVLTEFDGDKEVYTDFFRERLPSVFAAIFSLGEGMPSWEDLNHKDTFYEHTQALNKRALGSRLDDPNAGYLYQHFGNMTVKEIDAALKKQQ